MYIIDSIVLAPIANGLPQPDNDPHMVDGASLGRLNPDEEYVNAGVVETIGGDLPIYRVGTGIERYST